MLRSLAASMMPAVVAMYLPFCASEVRPATHPHPPAVASLWNAPLDLSARDLVYGPWGREHAPDPDARYTFVRMKHTGVNPGMTVRDPLGREWSVKQASLDHFPDEGPVEVVLSRVLSAVGYHQPPVYYLRTFTLVDNWGTRTERGGRFRLKKSGLKELDTWSWQQNPFVGTAPYQGLLVMLMMFNSSDLKNTNNSLYEYRVGSEFEHWYVVRDLGTALGSTGRFAPRKNDPISFARHGFIRDVRDGYVRFEYGGWHQEIVRGRITADEVRWASALLGGLTDAQWDEAFRTAGYAPAVAQQFIRVLKEKIAAGARL